MKYAQVILPLHLHGTFTYEVPLEFYDSIKVGMRVLVPFGGKKIYTGIVAELHQKAPEGFQTKSIINLLDDIPIVPEEQISFWNWLADYYMCELGEIYRLAFPSSLKLESETYVKLKADVSIEYENLDVNELYLVQALEVKKLINLSEIEAFIPKREIVKTINSLIDLRYIEIDEKIYEKYKIKEISYVKIKENLLENRQLTEVLKTLDKAPKQKELFLSILSLSGEQGHVKKSQLFDEKAFSYAQLKSLVDKNLVEEFTLSEDRLKSYDGILEEIESLSPIQKEAKNQIEKAFSEKKNVLLHGVTSSGKTHIYMELIHDCVEKGKNVLLLLPEIALTKQILLRLEKKYGSALGVYHQKLTDFERVEVWKKIISDKIKILVGTKNSIFLPFRNLGLIIMDEEHDQAYRNREIQPFFNIRDSAQMLASFYDARLLLGTATPSLESYYLAKKGTIQYVSINERFGNIALPTYEIIDLKKEKEAKTLQGNFSYQLIDEIKKNNEQKKQTIILHNRRGYANVIECETCGHVNYCTNCDVVMTYHKASQEMKCHYCGQKASKPEKCHQCGSEKLTIKGIGIEQIWEETKKLFPNLEVDRMDVDTMSRKYAYEKLYEKIEQNKTNILVGTQMVSKGLDFDLVDLIAIPKVDSLFHVQDFRAEERAYQLITQISGRAGRFSGKGKVVIQTYQPLHLIFQMLQNKNTEEIYQYLLAERKRFLYPPLTKLIMIQLKHVKDLKVDRASQFLASIIRKYLPSECVLGPERAPIARIKNKYQFQILLKFPRTKKYYQFKELLRISLKEFHEVKAYQSVKIDVIVDF